MHASARAKPSARASNVCDRPEREVIPPMARRRGVAGEIIIRSGASAGNYARRASGVVGDARPHEPQGEGQPTCGEAVTAAREAMHTAAHRHRDGSKFCV
eukprot:scaffold60268_cov27-Tisochrysis_lutea.AAC.16